MAIVFHHPPVPGSTNPFVDFDPSNVSHYPLANEQGLYVYGIRAKVDDELRFIPIVVGEGKLRNRLFEDHYLGKFSAPLGLIIQSGGKCSGDPKELWDFHKLAYGLSEIHKFYSETLIYDTAPSIGISKVFHVSVLSKLLFFQDLNFYHYKLGLPPLDGKINIKTEESIKYLTSLNSPGVLLPTEHVTRLISHIILTLNNFCNNFYFVYASSVSDSGNQDHDALTDPNFRKSSEHQLKEALKGINIYTTASANKSTSAAAIFDLSKIQDILVNVTGKPFGNLTLPLPTLS